MDIWTQFGLGITIIGFGALLIFLNGIAASFLRTPVRVPPFVITTIFIIGILSLMQAAGLIGNVWKTVELAIANSNLPEFVFGLAVVFLAVFSRLYEYIGYRPSTKTRIAMFAFGVLLMLDAIRILPILYELSQLISSALNTLTVMLIVYPWLSVIIVIAVIVGLGYLYLYTIKRRVTA